MTERPLTIAERWTAVEERVTHACGHAERPRDEVTIVAVSKGHPAGAVGEALAAGARDFGENYVQELVAKRGELGELAELARWHYIGRLQRNKAKLVAGSVALVHAVDSLDLARELGRRGDRTTPQAILLAVNLAGEATKGGVTASDASAIARGLTEVDGVRLVGLMTMPPPSDDPEASRPVFCALRALRERLRDELAIELPVLSMGMSDDFEVAIACGATHVRIGTAIFGPRPSK